VQPIGLKSSDASLANAVAAITARLESARSVVALPAFTVARLGLQRELRLAIEALGRPFATTSMEKCILDGSHPQFVGMYAGAVSAEKTREVVEGVDLVLDLGGVSLNDITTASYSAQLDPTRFVSVGLNDVRIGDRIFSNVRLADVLTELAKFGATAKPYRATCPCRKPHPAGG
jgi:indolepyruvate decarboxylase